MEAIDPAVVQQQVGTVLTNPPSVHSLIMIVLCMYRDAPGADHLSQAAQNIIRHSANDYYNHFYGENIMPDINNLNAYQRLANAYIAKVTELTNAPKLYFNGGPMVFIPVQRNEAWNNAAAVFMSNGHREADARFWNNWNPSDHADFFTGLPLEDRGVVVLNDILGKSLADFTVPDPDADLIHAFGGIGLGGAGAGGPGGAGAWGAGGPGGAGAAGGPGGGAGAGAGEMDFHGGRRRKTGRAHRKRRSHTSRRLRKRRQTRRGRKN